MLEFVIRLWNKNGPFLLVQEKQIFLIKLTELKEILDGNFLGLPRFCVNPPEWKKMMGMEAGDICAHLSYGSRGLWYFKAHCQPSLFDEFFHRAELCTLDNWIALQGKC